MTGQPPPLVQRFLDKVGKSRDLLISFTIHAILVAIFGGAILFRYVQPPPEEGFKATEDSFVIKETRVETLKEKSHLADVPKLDPVLSSPAKGFSVINGGDLSTPISATQFSPQVAAPVAPPSVNMAVVAKNFPGADLNVMSAETKQAIREFKDTWTSTRIGSRDPIFTFTAYIGQYQGGNWSSTVRYTDGKIETGSLPNLLYLMSHWSKDKISTNYKNVKALRLDSDELFTQKPPFIFLTGTRDFTLTDKEVENLRNYLSVGGCVWGDSSVPGQRSRFDIAFKREMRRVVGGDQDFAQLPANHPLFTQGYFSDVKSVPPGLNSYQLPVQALKMFGEVAVIYTANDYGDMWQIGLDVDKQVDLRRNASGQYVAINESLYAQREVYARNLSPKALETSFKFGTNVVMHLLTRWDSKVGRAPAL